MKLVLFVHHFPPNYYGGAELYADRIAHRLHEQGHAVEVVCIESITDGTLTPTCSTDTYNGLPVHRLRFDIRQAPNPFEWSFRNPAFGRWTKGFLQRACPDVVHVNSGYLLGGTVPEAAHELGIPTVLTLHDYWFMCPLVTLLRTDGKLCEAPVAPARCVWCSLSQKRRYGLLDRRLDGRLGDAFVRLGRSRLAARAMGITSEIEFTEERRHYLKQVLETIDLVIAPSRFAMHKIEQYGFAPRRMVYLPFGLETRQLSRPRPGPSSTALRIGYLGQFAPHKGVHLLLAAFQRLIRQPGSCELVLYGSLSNQSAYERGLLKIAQNDAAITFAGSYPNSKVGEVLNDLDVVVVPSLWYENRPTVIVEAHAAGIPVVAARLGGMAELIQHGENGLLFEPGSVASLTEQLQRLLDEPALLSQLRSGIRPVPTIDEETAALVSLYEQLASAPEPARSITPAQA